MGVKEFLDTAKDVKGAIQDPKGTIQAALKAKLMPYVATGAAILAAIGLVAAIIVGIVEAVAAEDEERQANSGMTPIYTGANWEKFLKYVSINEGGSKTADGAYYYVEDDSEHNPTIGHGLCLKSGSSYLHVDEFAAQGVDSKALADAWLANPSRTDLTVSVEICDQIWDEHLKGLLEDVTSTYSELNLKEYQLYALADVLYRRGNTNSDYGSFSSLYNSLWSSSDDRYKEDPSTEEYSMSSLYKFFNNGRANDSGVYYRKQRQWVLFRYGWFDYQDGTGEYWEEIAGAGDADVQEVPGQAHYSRTATVNGRTYIIWDQYSYSSSSSIYRTGCGPTTMAIILSGYGFDYDIEKAFNEFSPMQLIETYASHFNRLGVSATAYQHTGSNTEETKSAAVTRIRNNLLMGRPVMILVRSGPDSKFTHSAHFMAILGVTEDDQAIIANSVYGQIQYMDLKTLIYEYVYDYSSNPYQYLLINL